jgi:hypothetical protein
MAVAAAWIDNNWIWSNDQDQSGKFWIQDGRIWGPKNSGKFWIADGWIYGPEGLTQFWIKDGWIWGPAQKLPFA